MFDQFRELERPQGMRKKDVVLMATVSSFESVEHPTKSELRQFAELFMPLFQASTDEAKRQAVAALSQSTQVPPAVAIFIASQPIAVAAPFLIASPCLTDELLIMIARSQGAAHARAIVRREALSPTMIDALVGLRQASLPEKPAREKAPRRPQPPHAALAVSAAPTAPDVAAAAVSVAASPMPAAQIEPAAPGLPVAPVAAAPANATPKASEERDGQRAVFDGAIIAPSEQPAVANTLQSREEALRLQIKQLAAHIVRPPVDRLGLRTLTPIQAALLVRFARAREAGHFATTLADSLSSSRWLSERVMLDISGRQLALTLTGLGMEIEDAEFVLCRLYGHLAQDSDGASRAAVLLSSLDPVDCEERIESWRRADSYTYQTGDTADAPAGRENTDPTPERRHGPSILHHDDRTHQVLRSRKG
ncbi:MAG: hypothetical protein ACOH2J_02965 [Allorhizobium sp.]